MGMCKECKQVFPATTIKDGLCESCHTEENIKKYNTNDIKRTIQENAKNENFIGLYLKALKQYTVIDGRSSRSEYWYFMLVFMLGIFILTIIDLMIGTYADEVGLGILGGVFTLVNLIPSITIAIRRLHDINKSGWWYFINIIPLIGPLVFFYFTIIDSKEESIYGNKPKLSDSVIPEKKTILENDALDKIERLAELREKGIITDDEFNSKKQELLE